MESNWAAEHLQVIRTLMERSAVYRRALAPIMIYIGCVGIAAAAIGWAGSIESPRGFLLFWGCVAAVACGGSFLLVRRQALKANEPFWSPPTRRVTQAILPALVAGAIVSVVGYGWARSERRELAQVVALVLLPASWVVLYGCAFHAAGFFMPRGMKIFGWAFILGGSLLFAAGIPAERHRLDHGYAIMGTFFGLLHLAYGVYLYFTEKHRDET